MSYIEPNALKAAKNIARFLQRPLLLSGEPGTGKTTYAEHIQKEEGYNLYTFKTKSISNSSELFYVYDAISHFANKDKHVLNFISLQALGIAIINALGVKKMSARLQQSLEGDVVFESLDKTQREALIAKFFRKCSNGKSLVLLDEIDKAPRDFPNDILNEIENYEFEIKEMDIAFSLKDDPNKRSEIFVILTSNFEKNLPDAFLRRCIYHHIIFPSADDLRKIVLEHIGNSLIDHAELSKRIKEFTDIRSNEAIQKKPATSELIDCIRYLISARKLDKPLQSSPEALSTILKKHSDLETVIGTTR